MVSRSSKYDNTKSVKQKKTEMYETKHGSKVTTEVVMTKKRKLKVGNIFLLIVISLIIYLAIYFALQINITNIFISNNTILNDQEIIEQALISDYPSALKNNFWVIKKRLEKSPYIKEAKVKNKWVTRVYIKVIENKPMFYYVSEDKTVLQDGTMVDERFDTPILINYVPDKIYALLLEEFALLDSDVILKISEIKYDPNDVDEERFYLAMTDGNYVYLTIDRFDKINSYLSIVKNFENKKGILYLDSGEYFEVNKN